MKWTIFLSLILAPAFLLAEENNTDDDEMQLYGGGVVGDVEILYRKFWSLDSDGMPSFSEPNENFGHAVVHGDFNGDFIDDIATGIPGYLNNKGAVVIIYGTSSGLSANNSSLLFQSSIEFDDFFGYSLTTGDFNGDGFADLVVGSPFEDLGNSNDAGIITLFYGNSSGLSGTNTIEINAGTGQTFPDIEANAKFGWSLASGDFNGDGFAELVISLPNKTIAVGSPPVNISNAGLVRVFNGSASGINGANFYDIWQGSGGVTGIPETNDFFGYSLAAGDFDRDSVGRASGGSVINYDDLVIGVPFESFGASANGIVQIFMGSPSGLVYSHLYSQNNTADPREDNDFFGFTLATGSIAGGFFSPDDLVVGVPFEDVGSAVDAGMVHVFYGTSTGLTSTGNQIITQNSPGIFGTPEQDDYFGLALTVGRFNRFGFFGDEFGDLVIGTPNESYLATHDGVVTVVYGDSSGLDTNNSTFLSNGSASNNTNYGLSLTTARFTGQNSSFSSLIVGIPGQASDGNLAAGAIEELAFDGNDIIFKHGFGQ